MLLCYAYAISIIHARTERKHLRLSTANKNTIYQNWDTVVHRMRDSIKLRSRPRRAGDEQGSTGALHLDRFESLSEANKKRHPNGYGSHQGVDEGFD